MEDNMAVIYRITNMLTDDFYIGSAQSFERRVWQHRYDLRRGAHKNPHMQASWNKYGEDAFVFEVLEEVPEGEEVFEAENKYLHAYVGTHNCFNVNRDAVAARLGQVLTSQTKTRISESRKGKHAGEEHYRYGRSVSEEVRAKISETQKGRPSPMKGKKMSEHGRANVAAAVKRGPESHFFGKRPASAEALQKAVTVRFPDGREETFPSLTHIRDAFGVSIATTIRACKSRERVERGVFAGHLMWYAEEQAILSDEVPEEYRGLPRTRTEAKAQGARKYFTGEPCSHGHISARYVKGMCVACAAEEQRARSKRPSLSQ